MGNWFSCSLILRWCCSLFGSIVMISCTPFDQNEGPNSLPNILLIVSEDHGQDLGCYGNEVVHTPNIDSLAENGVRFVNAFTTYSVCSPSRSSIFTGLYPHQNGQIGLATHGFRMYKNFDNIPKYLKSKGYRTGCLGKIHVNPDSAILFDFHEISNSNFGKKNLKAYADKACEFIRAEDDPFFLMVNYPDAHFPLIREVEGLPTRLVTGNDISGTLPFIGAESKRLREVTADYFSQINRLDESIGMLLHSLRSTGKSENTLIIFLSDHGAQFSRGKGTNYEAGLKIPMVLYWPEKVGGSQVVEDKMVSVIDLFPTIQDVIGSDEGNNLPGISLMKLLNNETKDDWRQYIFADGGTGTAKYFYPKISVRGKKYKLIHNLYAGDPDPYFPVYTDHLYASVVSGTSRDEIKELSPEMKNVYSTWENPPEFEFYNIEDDPWEFNNLVNNTDYRDDLDQMKKVLLYWQVRTRDPFADPGKFTKIRMEVDSINRVYPDHSYLKDSSFSWQYPNYFGEYASVKK